MNPVEYQRQLNSLIVNPDYSALPSDQQQEVLRAAKDNFLEISPDQEGAANAITQEANQTYLRATGEGRYIPSREEIAGRMPWESRDWATKSQEDKELEIEKFRTEIPDLANQDPINEEDRNFYLNSVSDQAVRRARGGDTGWLKDKTYRVFEGFAAGTAGMLGMSDLAQDIRNYVSDNPDYDDDFSAKLASGVGDLGASSAIFIGATLATGNPAIGTAAIGAGTATRKYDEAYRQAIQLGLDEKKANIAGWAATPGAAVEIIGDRLIVGRFIPKGLRNALKKAKAKGNIPEQSKLIAGIMADKSLSAGAMRVARDGFVEGTTEALGDYASGYGAYLATDNEKFIPDSDSLKDSFLIGAVLGSGIGGIAEGSQIRYSKDGGFESKTNRLLKGVDADIARIKDSGSVYTGNEIEGKVMDLIRDGKYQEANKVSQTKPEPGIIEDDGGQQSLLLDESSFKSDKKPDSRDVADPAKKGENNIISRDTGILPFPDADKGVQVAPQDRQSQQPSPSQATEPVTARPVIDPVNADEETIAGVDAWDEANSLTHNNDGTPIERAVVDDVMDQVVEASKASEFSKLEMHSMMGDGDQDLRTNLASLIDNGWEFNEEQGRMVNPASPKQTALYGIAEIEAAKVAKSDSVATVSTTNKAGHLGRDLLTGDLIPEPNSDLSRIKFETQAALGQVVRTTDGRATTPANQEVRNDNESEVKGALKRARDAARKALPNNSNMKHSPAFVDLQNNIIPAAEGLELYYNMPNFETNENGSMKFGKLLTSKDGELDEKSLTGLIGWNGKPVRKDEIELWKWVAPQAFVKEGKVNMKELVERLKNAAPVIEHVILGEGDKAKTKTEYDKLSDRKNQLAHEMDGVLGPAWNEAGTFDLVRGEYDYRQFNLDRYEDKNGPVPEEERARILEIITEYNEISEELPSVGGQLASGTSAKWMSVAPKFETQMKGYVEILVRIPLSEVGRELGAIQFYGNHFGDNDQNIVVHVRGYEEFLDDGTKAFHAIELQGDWAAAREKAWRNSRVVDKGDGKFTVEYNLAHMSQEKYWQWESDHNSVESANEARIDMVDGNVNDNPLLSIHKSLGLKVAIQHALSVDAEKIVLSDAETAMMTQRHDANARITHEYTTPVRVVPELKDKMYNPTGNSLIKMTGKVLWDDTNSRSPVFTAHEQSGEVGMFSDHPIFVALKDLPDDIQLIALRAFGNLKTTVDQPFQAGGMRLNYDKILPKELGRLTGSKGVKVDMGESLHAGERLVLREDGSIVPNGHTSLLATDAYLERGVSLEEAAKSLGYTTRKRGSKVFKDADGFGKTNVTGLAFDVTNVTEAASFIVGDSKMKPGKKTNPLKTLKEIMKKAQERLIMPDGTKVTNGLELYEWIEKTDPHSILGRFLKNPKIKRRLLDVKVKAHEDRNAYDYENNIIYILDENMITTQHELSHALMYHALHSDPEFKSDVEAVLSETTAMLIDSGDKAGSILMMAQERYDKWIEAKFTPEEQEQMRMSYGLDDFIAKNFHQLRAEMEKTSGIPISKEEMHEAYGLSSADEFLAAVMSDPEFRIRLNQIFLPNSGTSAWNKFLMAIRKFVGYDVSDVSSLQAIDFTISRAFETGVVIDGLTGIMPPNQNELATKLFPSSEPTNRAKPAKQTPKQEAREKKNKVDQFLKRFKAIRKASINDKYDSSTSNIMKLFNSINPKELLTLGEQDLQIVYDLVNNIYESRKDSVPDPSLRIANDQAFEAIKAYKEAIDEIVIGKMMAEMDGIIDMTKFTGDPNSREDLMAFIRKSLKDIEGDTDKAEGHGKRYNDKQEAWKAKFKEAREMLRSEYSSANDWMEDMEAMHAQTFKSESLKKTLRLHFDYLHTIADVDSMDGKDLYTHFYSINNIIDGHIAYLPETTIRYIQKTRDGQVNMKELEAKFRDPMLFKNKFLKGIDEIARTTELMQTQLDRWSAFEEARQFLQGDLMGDLLESITIEAENARSKSEDEYVEAKKKIEDEVLKRKTNGEDRATMAIASRIIQFKVGDDPNLSIIQNILNERDSHSNALIDGDNETAAMHRDIIIPFFEKMVDGIEESDTPMDDFIFTMEDRIGLGDAQAGRGRKMMLDKMMDVVDSYRLDSEVISEAFHKKPFAQWANYLPRHTIPTEATKTSDESNSIDLAAEMSEFDANQYQTMSMVAIPSHLQSRRAKIGAKRYYSNNIESIFDRAIRMSSLSSSTTAERFILKERLKKGKPIFNVVKGESISDRRVRELEAWAKELIYNSMFNGESLGALGSAMKIVNEMFARVALSGLHQGVTQTISGYTDYQMRTGNIAGAMQGATFYLGNKTKMDQWFKDNARWIHNRSLMGEVELDRKKNPIVDENSIRSIPAVQTLEKIYGGAGKVITASLRVGDDFTAKSLVLAEYTRLSKSKGAQIDNITDVDWETVDGKVLSQSVINVERNVNASNKVLRGKMFTDRNKTYSFARNILFAFSSHVMTLSAQMNLAMRDIIELKKLGATQEEVLPKIKTIGAILSQTLAFSTGRFMINATIATTLLALMRELYDDEEGKIAALELELKHARDIGDPVLIVRAEDELKAAETVRKQLNKFKARNTSMNSFFKSVVREEMGVVHFAMNGPQIPQKILFMVPDKLMGGMMTEEKEQMTKQMMLDIKYLKGLKRFGEAAKLSEQLVALEASEYIPLQYPEYGNIGVGGITGTTMETMYSTLKEATDAAMGLKEFNYNDLILGAQSAGMGQADILRFFREVDRIEDKLREQEQGLDAKLTKAQKSAVDKREKERTARIKRTVKKLTK